MRWLFKRSQTNTSDKSAAVNFLSVLQWASSRQQLALEEWNDAIAAQASEPVEGDELFSAPLVEINQANVARLLPLAEHRLTSALEIRDEFAKLESADTPDILLVAIARWARVFQIHLGRCEKTVRDFRAYATGPQSADNNQEQRLIFEESEAMDEAIAAEHAVMERWGISFATLHDMMFSACNDLRLEIGKPKLSKAEYKDSYSRGMAGKRPRFYA